MTGEDIPMKKLKFIIIGAGLGGLTAAFCFARLGHDVIVLERSPSLTKKGGGILIRPNALRIFDKWGLTPRVSDSASQNPVVVLHNLTDDAIIRQTVNQDMSAFPDWCIPRPVLQDILFKEVIQQGVEIKFATKVSDVSESPLAACVVLSNGEILTADIVLAADGIRSRTRSKILADTGATIDPIIEHITMYQVFPDTELLRKDPDGRRLLDRKHLTIHMGQKLYVTSNIDEMDDSWHATFGVREPTDQQKLWDEEGDIEHVREKYKDACAPLRAALRAADRCDRWKLAYMPDLPRWTSKPEGGRIILIGDSAHAMLPNAAQGFSCIVEPIGVLQCLLEYRKSLSIRQITKIWEDLRKPRVEKIKDYAGALGKIYTEETSRVSSQPKKVEARRSVPFANIKSDMHAGYQRATFAKWVIDTDVVAEAKEYMERNKAKL